MKQKWIDAFMDTADRFAQLSSSRRLHVGAVVVKDNRIISIGYNGTPAGWDNNCENELKWPNGDVQFLETKPEVLHAEANAITKVAKSSESCYNADIYTTTAPCLECAKLIYQSGIKKVYWRTPHLRSTDGLEFLEKCGMEIEQI